MQGTPLEQRVKKAERPGGLVSARGSARDGGETSFGAFPVDLSPPTTRSSVSPEHLVALNPQDLSHLRNHGAWCLGHRHHRHPLGFLKCLELTRQETGTEVMTSTLLEALLQ